MSLIERFTPETLCISLSPDRITCAIRKGTSFLVESAYQTRIQNEDADWRLSLDALKAYFEASGTKGRVLPLSITLSSRWCRMLTIPWSDALIKSESAALFLQSQYLALHGDVARTWTITADDRPFGKPRIACAIDKDLLQSLLECTQARKHLYQSIEPIISAAWRAIAGVAGTATKAFMVIEPFRLTLGCVEQGQIIAVQSQPWAQSGTDELTSAWKRWLLRVPELADAGEVMILNLSDKIIQGELPSPFKMVLLPPSGLAAGYEFIACDRA